MQGTASKLFTPTIGLPVVAETEREDRFTHVAARDAAWVPFTGLVLVSVNGDGLLPLAGSGQWVICDPRMHPDHAPPHPDFQAPIAFVRLRDGRELIRRWHREKQTVTLTPVNPRLLGAGGSSSGSAATRSSRRGPLWGFGGSVS